MWGKGYLSIKIQWIPLIWKGQCHVTDIYHVLLTLQACVFLSLSGITFLIYSVMEDLTLHCAIALWKDWSDIPLWVWFEFTWWLVMMSFLLCLLTNKLLFEILQYHGPYDISHEDQRKYMFPANGNNLQSWGWKNFHWTSKSLIFHYVFCVPA